MIRSAARRRWGAVVAGLAVGVSLLAGCATDRTIDVQAPVQAEGSFSADTVAQMTAATEAALAATGAPAALVGVWAPWAGSWLGAVGADADGQKVSVDAGFRIGDLTRMMTCDVLYAVAADGTVELTDKVSAYVAGVPDLAEIELRQLCDGTSGLGSSQTALQQAWLHNPTRQWSPLEIAAQGLSANRAAPGGNFRDSDAAYQLLGLALERATGRSAAELLDDYVFEPLGMTQTALPSRAASTPNAAGGYLPGYTRPRTAEGGWDCATLTDVSTASASIGFTDSGVVSTIADMGTYLRAAGAGAFTKGLGGAEDRYGDPLPVGRTVPAWLTSTGGAIQAGSLIGQSGWFPGYMTAGYVDPGTGMVVMVVLDTSVGDAMMATNLAWQLASITSKLPAAEGFETPQFGLPWTAEQYAEKIGAGGIGCS